MLSLLQRESLIGLTPPGGNPELPMPAVSSREQAVKVLRHRVIDSSCLVPKTGVFFLQILSEFEANLLLKRPFLLFKFSLSLTCKRSWDPLAPKVSSGLRPPLQTIIKFEDGFGPE